MCLFLYRKRQESSNQLNFTVSRLKSRYPITISSTNLNLFKRSSLIIVHMAMRKRFSILSRFQTAAHSWLSERRRAWLPSTRNSTTSLLFCLGSWFEMKWSSWGVCHKVSFQYVTNHFLPSFRSHWTCWVLVNPNSYPLLWQQCRDAGYGTCEI